MTNPPCYKCDKRHYGCHAECAVYTKWAAAREREREHERSPCTDGHVRKRDAYLRRILRNRSGNHKKGDKG